jgi:hypothetical protein
VSADPFAVLGVAPGASGEEVAAAYRRLAKRWHPDRAGGQDAARRMAEINAAYDLVRSERWLERSGRTAPPAERPQAPSEPRMRAGWWLSAPLRRALGRELLAALEDGEDVAMVSPTSTWASPQALLAVTDRRLLWLLDDAPTHRVRSLHFRDVEHAEQGPMWPRRSRSRLRVQPRYGRRRWTFSDLRPATAIAIAGLVRAGAAVR